MVRLAIDAMGGDFAPLEIIKGVNLALEKDKELEVIIFGDKEKITSILDKKYLDRVEIENYPNKVSMGESDPIGEVRKNRDTSLVKSFEAVKDKRVSGVVTAGPTQAVVACGHVVIRRIKGMKRAFLCLSLPGMGTKNRLLLDVGANIELRSEHIVQLATFSSIYLESVKKIKNPLVGLINIGSEESKGREVDVLSYNALKESNVNFYGNIEPKEMFKSDIDIFVCDGYIGNILMKTTEGVATSIGSFLKKEIKKSLRSKIGYLFMKKVFNNFKEELNPDSIGGTMLFGLDGVVIKAHGSSNAFAFSNAIRQATEVVRSEVIPQMKDVLSNEQSD